MLRELGGAPSSTARRTAGGIGWTAGGYAVQGVAQLALLAVLARALTPADFGVVTATLVVVNLGRTCTQSVLSAAVVQRPVLDVAHVRAAFWLALGTGGLAAAVLWSTASPVASFFDMPRLVDVMRALAPMFIVQSAGVVAQGLLERELRFREVALADATAAVIGLAGAGIVASALGAGLWSLVIAHVAQAVVQTAVLLVRRPHDVVPRFGIAEVGELARLGSGLLTARVLNYAALQGDNVVVARAMSAAALGVYGRAYQLVSMPAMLIGQALDRVLLPLFARLDDRDALADRYRRATAGVVVLTAPLAVVTVVAADELVRVVLGDQWSGVVGPLRVFGVGLVARTAYKVSDTLARATGHVFRRAARQAVYAALVVGGALVGAPFGTVAVAAGVTVAIVANHVLMTALCARILEVRAGALLLAQVRPVLIGALTLPAAVVVRLLLVAAGSPALLTLAATAAVAGVTALPWLLRARRTWAA